VLGLWSISTITLELILCEIPEKRKIAARFARGISAPAVRRLTAVKARKISFNSLEGARKNLFQ